MEPLPRPFLSAVQGKLDNDIKTRTTEHWIVPLKAALHQLNLSLEEQERFTLHIQKYAATINPNELRAVPPGQVLPFLLSSLWAVHVSKKKSEEEEVEVNEEEEQVESEGSYETIELEDSDIPQGVVVDPDDPCAEGAESRGHRRNFSDHGLDSSAPKKYKLLLDNVAPFYVDKKVLDDHTALSKGATSRSGSFSGTGARRSQTLALDALGTPAKTTVAEAQEQASIGDRLRASRDIWRYTINHMEPEYRLPTLILKKHQYVKREEPRNIGPGCYDPGYCVCPSPNTVGIGKRRGQMYSCAPRFAKDMVKKDCPDPGAYGDPLKTYNAYVDRCKYPGKVPLMQSGPCDVRAKTFKLVGCPLGPGDYELENSTDLILKKKCGKRGPYDLFSQESRFDTIHGYYKTPINKLEPGMYGVYGTIKDIMNSRHNAHKGRLSKLAREPRCSGERIAISNPMWPTLEMEGLPGPGTYDIQEVNYRPVCWSENYWAFNLSEEEVRHQDTGDYDNAPTRYRPEVAYQKYCPIGCGFKSNFRKDGAKRVDPTKANILNERLRAKDIPPQEKHSESWRPC